jgi:hypothetical protein
MRKLLLAIVCLVPIVIAWQADAAQLPGPSRPLYNNPYYTCVKNYYVATTGSNSNNGTSPSTPWQTLQYANNQGRIAGDCVNVAPGTYTSGVSISHGGNFASPTGYVVYRCTTMDACIVTDTSAGGQQGSFVWNTTQPMGGNYIMIDGFTLAAASEAPYGQGVELANGTNQFTNSVHHVWILNSIISGYGQSGVQMNQGEYFFVVHNKIFNNSRVGCGAQGSGISFYELKGLPSYTPTPSDHSNSILGKIGTSFHNAVEWNVLYNNGLTNCGTAKSPYDTDGNNIIMDTLSWNGVSGAAPYTGGVLISFNVVYNAGGGGVHIFYSEDVTAANNSCYNNYLDPFNQASYRACMDTQGSYGNTLINNISVAVPTHATCAYYTAPYTMFNSAILGSPPSTSSPSDMFSNNITYIVGTSCRAEDYVNNGDVYSCSANKCHTNPGWVDVGNTSPGTEITVPVGKNFALQPLSPAIGYGLTASYLPPTSVDVGACASTFKVCP